MAFSINSSDISETSGRMLATNGIIQKSGHELTQIIKLQIMNEQGKLVDYVRNEYTTSLNILLIINF